MFLSKARWKGPIQCAEIHALFLQTVNKYSKGTISGHNMAFTKSKEYIIINMTL
jgi:hypothetical protein